MELVAPAPKMEVVAPALKMEAVNKNDPQVLYIFGKGKTPT